MRRIKSREELTTALHLTQTEIQRLFDLSYSKAKKVFTMAMKKDAQELKERMIFEDKARTSSVLWVLDISRKEFERFANEIKSGSRLQN